MTHTSMKLSAGVIKAQQALSDRFGIPTFNLSGGISTVPISGIINQKINVGGGKFKSLKEFNVAVNRRISEQQVKKFTQSVFSKKGGIIKKPTSVFSSAIITAPSKKTIAVPKVLSKTTLAEAQQALSDRFGIPTFNLSGGISTVPISGVFKDINVGFGKFKTEESFIDAVVKKFFETEQAPIVAPPVAPPTGNSFFNNIADFFSSLFQTEPQDTATGTFIGDTGELSDESTQTILPEFLFGGSGGQSGDIQAGSENDESFFDSILNSPVKLGLGIVVLAVVAMSLGGGKKRRRR